ncbi:MAG TPA: ABC transporter permease [Candidatus Kapabacteria bacterium]|nr:ABC transporter permease [Candidatus Kapabacteria bacterium]
MKELLSIIKRELRKVFLDRNLALIFFVAPIAYPLLYGAIYLHKAEENVPIAVLDRDNTNLSRSLVREIDAHQNISVTQILHSEDEIIKEMAKENIHGAIIIPQNFSENLKYGRKTSVQLLINPGRLLVLSDIGLPISQIVTTYGAKVTASALMKKGTPVLQEIGYAQPVKINFQYLFNPYLTYGDLILPGLLIIIISQIIFIGVAASQAKEWGMNKWRDQFLVSRNISLITAGKLISYILFFIIYALIYFIFLAPFYHIGYQSTLASKLLIATLGIAASASFGLFVGTFFKHRITVFVILGFTSYPFFMLTGFAWPQNQLLEAIKYFSYLFPLVPFLQAIMKVTQMQNSLYFAINELTIMIVQTILYSTLFYFRVNKIKKRKLPKDFVTQYIEGFDHKTI